MNDKKNIERFFQEKFKDFEANPEQQSWANISKKLNEKKTSKTIFPTWLQVGGIAACLIVSFLVYQYFVATNENSNLIENNSVVVNSDVVNSTTDANNAEKQTSTTNKQNNNNNVVTNKTTNDVIIKNAVNSDSKIVASSSESSSVATNKNNFNFKNKSGIANSKNKIQRNNKSNLLNNNNSKIFIAAANRHPKKSLNSIVAIKDKSKSGKNISNKNNSNNDEIINNESNEIITNSDANKSDDNNINNDLKIDLNEIEYRQTDNSNKQLFNNDSIKKLIAADNPLDKIAKEKEKSKKENNPLAESSRWKIRPNVAPIFMKASNGSPIHDIFADNEKTYENRLSYGLGADYAITKKFSIRAGINKFDLVYNTNDVAYYSDLTALNGISPDNSIQTINLRDEFQNIVIGDKKSRAAVAIPPNQTAEETGYLNQKFGYIEIPIEVSYKILDKRFGITLISGFSTLLLNNNEVSIVSSNKTIVLGDVNNLSKTHYSSNFGIGFKYNFMKSFEINVEPTIKYQINSFDKNNGGFNPYFLGIYSGISYKL